MKKVFRQYFPFHRFTAVRFGLVALFGETFYFILYWCILTLTNNTSLTLALAGGICVIVNAYVHSRITFRVAFNRNILLGYIAIQLLGYLIAMVFGIAMDRAGANKWLIALATYFLWAMISYILSKHLYGAEGRKAFPPQTPVQKAPTHKSQSQN